LGEVSRGINKESLNLESELVLRTLGKEKGASAPDPEPRKMDNRSDDKSGLAVIKQWLERAGIGTRNSALHDGSGLSRLNLVTPEMTVRLLIAISKTPSANVFRDSLPVAGRDGTLGNRIRSAAGRLNAKTGTQTHVNSLSGYAITRNNELLAFSIFCNNNTENSCTPTIDAVAFMLTTYPSQ
jgi:D-alanyl-D-alanine carboxypeptidase/D-alanyl-D-alanine-endopeptidase (penicillin-binding protein 4)